ncbi:hypothetical protein BU16DRAFT_525026 [Lophium mytilinum]|uniref:Uncharacterized protein n=1 Tax=Lophium mytilinum TaxID=390894 RepID=A0A6A6R034_9PEZI|nr:hypothetical protein BU16DRAFT_525026 [Lophium mytilinum]
MRQATGILFCCPSEDMDEVVRRREGVRSQLQALPCKKATGELCRRRGLKACSQRREALCRRS